MSALTYHEKIVQPRNKFLVLLDGLWLLHGTDVFQGCVYSRQSLPNSMAIGKSISTIYIILKFDVIRRNSEF